MRIHIPSPGEDECFGLTAGRMGKAPAVMINTTTGIFEYSNIRLHGDYKMVSNLLLTL